jgi:hypothetical protein
MQTREAARTPSLAPPFAIVGLAAGWLAVGVLANPLVYRSNGVNRPLAGLLSAGVGALVGAFLSRPEPVRTFGAVHDIVWRLVLPVLAGGAVAASIISGLAEGSASRTSEAAVFGVVSAIAMLPICRAVVLAAQRSARARMGSLVARADRRAVWSILATSVGVATLAAAVDWPPARSGWAPWPWVSLGIALAATGVVAAVKLADGRSAKRVRELARESESMDECDPEAAATHAARVRVDLGLGDQARARVDHGAVGYRDRDRPAALLVGSPEQARVALEAAMRRGTASLVALATVLAAHGLAAGSVAGYLYHSYRCDHLSAQSCREAALLGDRQEGTIALHRRACDGAEWQSCDWLAARGLGRPR